MWAAEKLGLTGAAADTYAKEVVTAEIDQPKTDIVSKLRKDFDAKGVTISDAEIRKTMTDLLAKAVTQIQASG
jgi:hypothetical protein